MKNFEFNDEDFDFEEMPDIDIPKIGDYIKFNEYIYGWSYDSNYWMGIKHPNNILVKDIVHIKDIEYLYSSVNGNKIPIGDNKLPTDYDGYLVILGGYWPWFKLENYKIIDNLFEPWAKYFK